MRATRKPRRGVLLLIILGLLAVFCLIGLTFVLVSSQQKRSARSGQKLDQVRDPAPQLLDQAFAQVVRGTKEPAANQFRTTGVGAHSLLETMYGNNAKVGAILKPNGSTIVFTPLPSASAPQLIQFSINDPTSGTGTCPDYTLPIAAASTNPTKLFSKQGPLKPADTRQCTQCVGCVLTMLNGPAAGCSTRIVAYDPSNPTTKTFTIAATDQITYTALNNWFTQYGSNDSIRYLVNGVPFSGLGFGYNPSFSSVLNMLQAKTDQLVSGQSLEVALLPNFCDPRTSGTGYVGDNRNPPGGANTDYTAPDYNHMLLAMVLPQHLATANSNVAVPVPSLHRPELLRYWSARAGVTTYTRAKYYTQGDSTTFGYGNWRGVARAASFRPNPYDHPAFWQNVNANFNPYWDGQSGSAQWDVDNMGTGVPDSVWVDLGLPVRSTPDGRLYKPLFAILCVDLDGRLNFNAHGTTDQLNNTVTPGSGTYYTPQPSAGGGATATGVVANSTSLPPNPSGSTRSFANNSGATGSANWPLPRGQGFGPAEIALGSKTTGSAQTTFFLFSGTTNQTYLTQLLQGLSAANLPGRYGEMSTTAAAGVLIKQTPFWRNMLFSYSGSHWTFSNLAVSPYTLAAASYAPDAFRVPPDLRGKGAIGLDVAGRPIYRDLGDDLSTTFNSPYELNLAARQAWLWENGSRVDCPFTPAELERVLRPNDTDAQFLPPRLLQLTAPSGQTPYQAATSSVLVSTFRNEFTTESWDAPCPAIALSTPVLSVGANKSYPKADHPADLLYGRDTNTTAGTYNVAATDLIKYLPPDVLSGLRMDINRPFGPGYAARTTTSNYAVDEPLPTGTTVNFSSSTQLYGSNRSLLGSSVPCDATDNSLNLKGAGASNFTSLRQTFAQQLYCLACLVVDKVGLKTRAGQMLGTDDTSEGLGSTAQAARVLAQWAVNVADFRSRDGIMSRFDYDPNFMDNVGNSGYTWSPTKTVWGCARPELLLMETLAFHDRRCEDTNSEKIDQPSNPNRKTPNYTASHAPPGTAPNVDPDFDQQWRPQGSLFVKLYNPWTELDAPAGALQYDGSGAKWNGGVRLNQTTPSTTGNHPVWRLAIATGKGLSTAVAGAGAGPVQDSDNQPPDPDIPAFNNGAAVKIVRTAYFVNLASATNFLVSGKDPTNSAYAYYPSTPANIAPLLPGRYAVVGSGEAASSLTSAAAERGPTAYTTWIGFTGTGNPGSPGTPRRIVLTPNSNPATAGQVHVYAKGGTTDELNDTSTPITSSSIQPPIAVPIDMAMTPSGAKPRRLSVSEPNPDTYYPEVSGDKTTAPKTSTSGQYSPAWDFPLDEFCPVAPYPASARTPAVPPKVNNWTTTSWWTSVIGTTGSQNRIENFCVVYLQRLADPTKGYDASLNPYLTVDQMPIDLTTFNGVSPTVLGNPGEATNGTQLYSRVRGLDPFATPRDANAICNIWGQDRYQTVLAARSITGWSTASAPGGSLFNAAMSDCLGYMNWTYGKPLTGPARYAGEAAAATASATPPIAIGTPTPIPWLTWNNRPYTSPLELMYVPWVSSSRLLRPESFSLTPVYTGGGGSNNVTPDPYTPSIAGKFPPTATAALTSRANVPFFHLLNFFDSTAISSGPGGSPQLHRILEYLRVPSPFVGTATQFNPTSMQTGSHNFRPPFNWLSNYREPGRLNLNTIYSKFAWRGLMNQFPQGDPGHCGVENNNNDWGGDDTHQYMWEHFLVSRRAGYNAATAGSYSDAQTLTRLLTIQSSGGLPIPTRFENPFRSSLAARCQPLAQLATLIGPEVNATLLRKDYMSTYSAKTPATAGVAGSASATMTNRPLFQYDIVSGGANTLTVAGDTTGLSSPFHPMNSERNPYFRYQGIQRLGQLTTTRSNVYAVWITVGYFECRGYSPTANPPSNPNPGNATNYGQWASTHPDGVELVQELGADTGDITRHRAFYIIDRTIPVGFVRGHDLNFDKAVLVKRFIE